MRSPCWNDPAEQRHWGNTRQSLERRHSATYDLNNSSSSFSGLTGAGTVINTNGATSVKTLTITGSGGQTFTGTINPTAGTAATNTGLVINLTSGIQTLSGANSYTGPTTVSGGTLGLATTGSLGNTAVAVGSGASNGGLQINNGNYAIGTTAASLTVGGTTGVGTVTFANAETGVSTLTINNANDVPRPTSRWAAARRQRRRPEPQLQRQRHRPDCRRRAVKGECLWGDHQPLGVERSNAKRWHLQPADLRQQPCPHRDHAGNLHGAAGDFGYLTETATNVILNLAAGATGNAYWTGSQNTVWSTNPSGPTNFTSDLAGTTPTNFPIGTTNVFETATGARISPRRSGKVSRSTA